jgi:hypothetical protein
MSYTMTRDSLLGDLRRYLERGFTAESDPAVFEQLPHLITLAERRIARELKIQGFIRPIQTTLQVGEPVLQKPDRWRDTVSMTVNGKPIFPRSYEYLRSYWPDPALLGEPRFYADYDYQHWLLAPTPNTTANLEVLIYQQPQLLGDDVQVNWITEFLPDMLLYAALLEATPFLKNDQRIATWQTFYDRAAAAVSGEDLKRIMDRSANRSES